MQLNNCTTNDAVSNNANISNHLECHGNNNDVNINQTQNAQSSGEGWNSKV